MLGKVQVLEIDCNKLDIDVFCVQEGRSAAPDVRDGIHYTMYVGSADPAGSYGCQVWISSRLRFQPQVVRHVSARLSIVAGFSPVLSRGLLVVCGHAPTEASSASIKDSFWDPLNRIVLDLTRKFPKYLRVSGIDCNGRVHGHGHHIGTCEPEAFTDNGFRLLDHLSVCSLVATNTFFNAGYTWRSKHGKTSRIDFTLLGVENFDHLVYSSVAPDVVLSYTPTEDHRLVVSEIRGFPGARDGAVSGSSRPQPRARINKAACCDPSRCQNFTDLVWQFRTSNRLCSETFASEFTEHVYNAAISSFGSFHDAPRKPWISPTTWSSVRTLAPLRRVASDARRHSLQAVLQFYLCAWAGLVHQAFYPGSRLQASSTGSLGWHAVGRRNGARRDSHVLRVTSVAAWRAANAVQKMIKPAVAADRAAFIEAKTAEAHAAHVRGDSRTTYAILRALGGRFTSKQPQHVEKPDGALTTSEAERQARWLQHYTDVFKGTPMSIEQLRGIPHEAPIIDDCVDVSPSRVEEALMRLKSNRGAGRDGIAAEVLRAGGGAVASKLSEVYGCVVSSEVWPSAWAGSRVVEVHKKKGSKHICDEYRGIHLDNHMSKGLKEILNDLIKPQYEAGMPASQFGAVSRRGTDFASHVVLTFIDRCKALQLCTFILYVDLSKAFDKALRELVLGIPLDCKVPNEYFASFGLAPDQVSWVMEFVSVHGPLMKQWGVPDKVVRLVKNLHSMSWLSYGDIDTAVSVRLGGKQGCKFGSTIFNGSYSVGLLLLRDALLRAGVVLRVRRHGPDFLSPAECDSTDDTTIPIVDVAFVDDECLMLCAKSASELDACIDVLLVSLSGVFSLLQFEINWKPGKTECSIVYRGKNAAAHYQARRAGPADSMVVRVPGSVNSISVVHQCKHLGGVTEIGGNNVVEVRARSQAAAEAYSPLSVRIYGNSLFPLQERWSLLRSLVFSRLFFNAHIRVWSLAALRVLNASYMRCLRRLVDQCRYGPSASDLEVRLKLKAPSVDCVLRCKRLVYFGRVVRQGPTELHSLLAPCPPLPRLPWVQLVLEDLQCLWRMSALCSGLPDPSESFAPWVQFIAESPARWSHSVNCIFFVESVCDLGTPVLPPTSSPIASFKCDLCNCAFASDRALRSHRRAKHGTRVSQRLYCLADGTCQVCGTRYRSRLRLLAHLCDSRRTRCWEAICARPASYVKLSDSECSRLDSIDNDLRHEARRCGHSHAPAVGQAFASTGRAVGRCTRQRLSHVTLISSCCGPDPSLEEYYI